MEIIKYDPHPNIVKCYDILKKDTDVCIILEYCDSGDLRNILKKPIKEKYAQFYFTQLVNGLKYLDKKNIIHRDIKPKNILLTDNRKLLKIADFGFAKISKNDTLNDTVCGSPLYMAPEIMKKNLYNNQTDLWSLGMILYEMLYGFHPYSKCESIPELQECIEKKKIEIPPTNTLNRDVGADCINLLKKMLQKDASNRITWNNFFSHPWLTVYQYKIKEDYEEKIKNTQIDNTSNYSNDQKSSPKCSPETPPAFDNYKIKIIKDFYDKIQTSKPVDISYSGADGGNNNHNKNNNSQEIFDMEMDNKIDNKISVRNVLDKSGIIDGDTTFNIVDIIK
jgi:serine/threonine-protein kinase ULK/ATG1